MNLIFIPQINTQSLSHGVFKESSGMLWCQTQDTAMLVVGNTTLVVP